RRGGGSVARRGATTDAEGGGGGGGVVDPLGGNPPPLGRAILVLRADQFDRGSQPRATLVEEHLNFDRVNPREIDGERSRRCGRRPRFSTCLCRRGRRT